jgi:divalent metal cation (Fe/Co/Zn/Cd) transporter
MNKLLKKALVLGIITIVYNIIEGLVSVFFGAKDETLALLGFGIDSFVEVISGIGIVHMILRMQYSSVHKRDSFERTALIINGSAFYLLTAGLVIGSVLNTVNNVKPSTTSAGIIISLISIGTMYYLLKAKLKVGRELNSDAIIADANCTRTCFYLSFILLFSSGLYEIFRIGYFDILGSLGIAYYAFKEGSESFRKSRSEELNCGCEDE